MASHYRSSSVSRLRRRIWVDVFHPIYWPNSLRRIAILTAPLAVSVWIVMLVCTEAMLLVYGSFSYFHWMWSQPRRRRRERVDYGYVLVPPEIAKLRRAEPATPSPAAPVSFFGGEGSMQAANALKEAGYRFESESADARERDEYWEELRDTPGELASTWRLTIKRAG